MKIPPVGAELFHAEGQTDGRTDGRTDMTKLTVAFRTSAQAPNKHIKLMKFDFLPVLPV